MISCQEPIEKRQRFTFVSFGDVSSNTRYDLNLELATIGAVLDSIGKENRAVSLEIGDGGKSFEFHWVVVVKFDLFEIGETFAIRKHVDEFLCDASLMTVSNRDGFQTASGALQKTRDVFLGDVFIANPLEVNMGDEAERRKIVDDHLDVFVSSDFLVVFGEQPRSDGAEHLRRDEKDVVDGLTLASATAVTNAAAFGFFALLLLLFRTNRRDGFAEDVVSHIIFVVVVVVVEV